MLHQIPFPFYQEDGEPIQLCFRRADVAGRGTQNGALYNKIGQLFDEIAPFLNKFPVGQTLAAEIPLVIHIEQRGQVFFDRFQARGPGFHSSVGSMAIKASVALIVEQ